MPNRLPRGRVNVNRDDDGPIPCDSEEGITIGLIDSIITQCRVLAARDWETHEIREAFVDLRCTPEVRQVIGTLGKFTQAQSALFDERGALLAVDERTEKQELRLAELSEKIMDIPLGRLSPTERRFDELMKKAIPFLTSAVKQ